MLDFISSIAVLIAALTFIAGVSVWRREFIGKRRIELAETMLAMFYEAADVIRQIRNPGSFVGEGKTRKRAENELKEDSILLDQAYIVIERYQKSEALFSRIKSMRYQVQATFGASASVPFDELNTILNEIFHASQMLGSYYWPRQGRVEMAPEEFRKYLEEKNSYEAVICYMGEEKDIIAPRVQKIIEKVENILQVAFPSQDDFAAGTLDDIKSYMRMCVKLFKKSESKDK